MMTGACSDQQVKSGTMKNRNDRLMAIRKLINDSDISSQEELMRHLVEQGYQLTQATLSRDLKFLKVAKIPDPVRGYVYVLTEKNTTQKTGMDDVPFSGYVSIDFARGMAIMKTLPGHASSIAYALDNLDTYEIAGTIAGDDTILIIPRDGVTKMDILQLLKNKIPGISKDLMN